MRDLPARGEGRASAGGARAVAAPLAPSADVESRAQRRIVWLSSAAHALVHAEMLVFAVVLLPLASELGLSLGRLGMLGTLSYVCFGAGAPAAGWLADRFGPRRVLVGCMLGSAGATGALVLARGPAAVGACLVGLGLAASLYHPAGLGLLSIRARALGRALAVHGMAGNFGLAVTPLAAAALTAGGGWRAPYAALAVVALGLAAALLTIEPARAAPAGAAPGPRVASACGPLALLLALTAVLGLVYRGSMTFLPAHILESFSGPASDAALFRAGLVTSFALGGGMLGQLLAGRALGRRPAEGLLVVVLAAAVPLLAAIALLGGPALVAAVFLFVVAHFAHQPLTNALLAGYSRPQVRSRIYGISFAFSFGVGGLAAWAGGVLAEARGTPAVFLALAVLGVLALLLGLGLRWRAGRRAPAGGEPVPAAW